MYIFTFIQNCGRVKEKRELLPAIKPFVTWNIFAGFMCSLINLVFIELFFGINVQQIEAILHMFIFSSRFPLKYLFYMAEIFNFTL